MRTPKNILLQTTIPFTENDWHIGRFSLLKQHLESLEDENGDPLYRVTARDREQDESGSDSVLKTIDQSDIDELWLFAVDAGDGLSTEDCEAITRFRKRGGGILATRDHNDLGSSLCTIGGVGEAHYFHSKHPDPDPTRCCRDDQENQSIDYPNYHSGANGDYQTIDVIEQHELLTKPDGSLIKYFPAHPHEGGIGAPEGNDAVRVIATGTSQATGRPFNLIVAFDEKSDGTGRAIAESSFHHLVDYNWDIESSCPPGITEAPGDGYKRDPEALNDIKQYVENAAKWLKPIAEARTK
jgi:hypothetical protein